MSQQLTTSEGFLHFWLVGRNGNAQQLDFSQLENIQKGEGFHWIHLNRSDPNVQDWLIRDPDIDATVTESLLAEDTRPRATPHGDGVLLNLRGINFNPGGEPEDMVALRMWIEPHRIVTVQGRNLRAVDSLLQQFISKRPPLTPGDFVADLAIHIATYMAPTVTDLNAEVDDLEEQVLDADAGSLRVGLGELRRKAIMIRRYLAPQRDALNSLAIQNFPWITDRDRLRLREGSDQTTRLTEELDAVRERAAIVYDQLVDKRAEEMNRTMLVLAVVAAIFLPLGLIAGMMGMNVGGMPLLESPLGFWITSAVIALTGAATVAIFKIMKWM
ncbi:MAG: zinc transporter ZntB [Gammaproteobacteria bacterium]|nr:zinc transporter ZntB [Gammaproteobacteria bacterium]NNC98430.1 zinc transporter ZntB [Gammaproteobacteria bacterium]NNM14737.1 zinc transporter ZntB [Gammaproteobacteria bacterium]